MEAFVRVVDAGSFSGAAKQLRLGQIAVSKTIAQLEERLGHRRSEHGSDAREPEDREQRLLARLGTGLGVVPQRREHRTGALEHEERAKKPLALTRRARLCLGAHFF